MPLSFGLTKRYGAFAAEPSTCQGALFKMGSAFSGPSSEELLRAYGSIQLLSTLKLPTRVTTELSALEDATVQTSEPLTTIPPEEVYQQTSQLCHDIGMERAVSVGAAWRNVSKSVATEV